MKRYLFTLILLSAIAGWSMAQKLAFAPLFGEEMVLQRNAKVNIWGTAPPATKIAVEIQNQKQEARADEEGRWLLQVNNLQAGGPFELTLTQGTETLSIKNIYVGEVWIAGGQSNMQFRLDQEKNAQQHIAEASNNQIRYLFVPQTYYAGHKVKDTLKWRTATGSAAGKTSAIAYFFAKELQQKLNVPVGIICNYKGGTPAESWMRKESLLSIPELATIWHKYERVVNQYKPQEYEQQYALFLQETQRCKEQEAAGNKTIKRPAEPMGIYNYKRPAGLHETMIRPILPFTAQGVIWYQGEANAPRPEQYQILFPALINEWRKEFQNPDMPFYFVQLSNYDHPAYPTRANWAELREAQLLTWQRVSHTAMAVSIDCGDKNDIHPTYKEPIGKRLAACALNQTYRFSALVYSGPVYQSIKKEKEKVILSFTHTGSGLKADGEELRGFTICGASGHFVPATARINGHTVIVSSPEVDAPVAVRYGWANYTDANLFNKEGFPATPFRTDNTVVDLPLHLTKGKP